MPLISPFGHIIKGQDRHPCSREKLLSGVLKREKIKKATCKGEAHGAEEVCPCNSSAVTSRPRGDKINGSTLSSTSGNWAPMASHRWWAKVCAQLHGAPSSEKLAMYCLIWQFALFSAPLCSRHSSSSGGSKCFHQKNLPNTPQSSEITPVINSIHFSTDRKALKI